MKLSKYLSAGAACVGALAFAGASHGVIMIDNFDNAGAVWPLNADAGTPTANNSESGVTDVIGGQRDGMLMFDSGSNGTSMNITGGQLAIGADPDTNGTAMLTYPQAVADLSLATEFEFLLVSTDFPAQIDVMLTDGGGGTATGSVTSPGLASNVSLTIPIGDFAGVDLADITEIKFTFPLTPNQDSVFDFFGVNENDPPPPNNGAVPEPVSATLGFMGLGALSYATRRRKA